MKLLSTHAVQLRKTNESLREWVSDYRHNRTIAIEHTRFTGGPSPHSGLNGVDNLVKLDKRVFEAREVYLDQRGSSMIQVYIRTRHRECDQTERLVYILSDAKGKTHYLDMDVSRGVDDRHREVDTLVWKVKDTVLGKTRDELQAQCEALLKYIDQDDPQQELKAFLEGAGYKVKHVMTYNESYVLSIHYATQTDSEIEIGYNTQGTYNNLPGVFKISKAKQVKKVSLYDLGVESPGSYSHDNKCAVLPEQVKAVKEFKRRFDRKFKQSVATVKKGI